MLLDEVWKPGALRVLFQPIVDLQQDRVHAFEALVRGPAGTNLERADVLFEYARRKLCEQKVDVLCMRLALSHAAALPAGSRVSLNVHASTLASDTGFLDLLGALAADTGVSVDRLVLEIVEFAPSWGGGSLFRTLERLRSAGCAIALDDVGHGHSNFRMILDSSPDYLKVDRYLVANASHDARRRSVLESIRDLADRLGAAVVAEGVEEPADLALLRAMGIRYAQGFLLSRPLAANAFTEPDAPRAAAS